ncbi:MAG: ComEC/Rec2 family competence protein [Bacillota bacterium]|nr:ComEC/Rec2 family competence protein [Bacillota bacterium]
MKTLKDNLKGRYLVAITFLYIIGIAAGRICLEEPSFAYFSAALLLFSLVSALVFGLLEVGEVLLLLAVLTAGGMVYAAEVRPAESLAPFIGYPVYVEGTVDEEPLFYEDHADYRLKIDLIETREGRFPVEGTLLVKIYGDEYNSYWFGERLRLRGNIVEPQGRRNPGGFDYSFYLHSRGIDALIYPLSLQVDSLGQGDSSGLQGATVKIRRAMSTAISRTLPSPAAELLTAVLFGRRQQLPEDVEINFRQAGVGHLMAVSGLHVGLVAAMVLGLERWLGFRGRLPLLWAIILVFAYAALTGMRPSAMRAALMVACALGALLLERERDLPTAVAFAALVTLFINPLLLFDPGFQFSYAATLAIVYISPMLKNLLVSIRMPSSLGSILAVTTAAQIGVLPLSVYHFHHLPVGALFFNLILLPLMGVLVGLGLTGALAYLIFPFVGELLLWGARPLLEIMLFVTRLSAVPGLYRAVCPPGEAALILFYVVLVAGLFIYYRTAVTDEGKDFFSVFDHLFPFLKKSPADSQRFYLISLFLALAAGVIIMQVVFSPSGPYLTVTFLDVGQGAAAQLETADGSVVMVDAGGDPAYLGDPGAVGEKVVLPFLRYKGTRRIDLAVITHPHEDHYGGFLPIVGTIPVDTILVSPQAGESPFYRELLARAESAGTAVSPASAGQFWHCGPDMRLEFLSPPKNNLYQGTNSDLNNNSLVFRLCFGEISLLFTGDIEDPAVENLLSRDVDLKADLLVVPHHGGYLENMPRLLERVQPRAAVIQVGANQFGHPHPFILESIAGAGVELFRTDLHGAVILETDGLEMQIRPHETKAASGF